MVKIVSGRKLRQPLKKIFRRGALILWLLVFAVLGWMWYDGRLEHIFYTSEEFIIDKTAEQGFILENIYVSGNKHVSTPQIMERIGAFRGTPILAIPLEDARQRLLEFGWIEDVKIDRQLPETLHVIVTERKPFAIWQYRGKINLIDIKGNIISEGTSSGYSDLPIIVGEDANLTAEPLFTFLAKDTNIFKHISSVIRVGNRRWNVRLSNGIEIKLPEENPQNAWQNILDLHAEKKILDKDIKSIDMRVLGKLFIEP